MPSAGTLLAGVLAFLAACAASFAAGVHYHAGQDAIAAQAAADVRQADARAQRHRADQAAGEHAQTLDLLKTQLGDAREKIATLSGRDCLGPDTVRMLNAIGAEPVRAAADDATGAAPAATSGTGLRYSTDRDTASNIAACRTGYAELSSQLNRILDIEDAREAKRR